jgi:hypothetical protein
MESGRKIYANRNVALDYYGLRRGHDETGQRAGLRRHGDPLGGLLCVGPHCIQAAPSGAGERSWVAP